MQKFVVVLLSLFLLACSPVEFKTAETPAQKSSVPIDDSLVDPRDPDYPGPGVDRDGKDPNLPRIPGVDGDGLDPTYPHPPGQMDPPNGDGNDPGGRDPNGDDDSDDPGGNNDGDAPDGNDPGGNNPDDDSDDPDGKNPTDPGDGDNPTCPGCPSPGGPDKPPKHDCDDPGAHPPGTNPPGNNPPGTNPPGTNPGAPIMPDKPPYVDVPTPNYKFCRWKKHDEETAVYSYNRHTGSSNLYFGIVNTDQNFEPDDNVENKNRIRKLIQSFQSPHAITGKMPTSSTSSGNIRFPDAEKPVITFRVNLQKLDHLRNSATNKYKTTILLFDDRDGDGTLSSGDRVVSSNDVDYGDLGRQHYQNSSNIIGASIFDFIHVNQSRPKYEFMLKTFLFNGSGKNGADCKNVIDPELREICKKYCDKTSSPLTIDLANNGFALTSPEKGVRFDITADGKKEKVGWFNSGTDDALIVYDRNGNGRVDDGSELFGNATPVGYGMKAANGFVALAQLDSDRNGLINENDAEFQFLQLWRDVNRNGISERRELVPMSSVVRSVSLNYWAVFMKDNNGNVIYAESTVHLIGGGVRNVSDIWFAIGQD